jgi:hypothetical protein
MPASTNASAITMRITRRLPLPFAFLPFVAPASPLSSFAPDRS